MPEVEVDEQIPTSEVVAVGADVETGNDVAEEVTGPCWIEVKKLAVCRDTGETILHRAARMGHAVS